MGLSRRKFTTEFKAEVMRRLELGASVAEVARACELNPQRAASLEARAAGEWEEGLSGMGPAAGRGKPGG